MTRLSNTAAWILSGVLFLVVVAWTNLTALGLGAQQLTYDDVALPRLAIALVGAAAVWLVLAIMLSKGNVLLCDPTWWLLGALAAWALVCAAVAKTPIVWLGQSERLEGAVTVILYAVLFGAGLQLGRSSRYVRRFAGAFTVGAVVLAIHGLLQTARLDPTNYLVSSASFYLGSAFASLGNPNFLAGLLVLALPIAVGLALTASSRVAQVAWWASAALVLGALYATYSQGSWLAAVLELALAIGLWVWSRQRDSGEDGEVTDGGSRRSLGRAALIAGLILAVGVAVIVGVTAVATQRGLRLWGSGLAETGSGRVLLTQTSLGAIADKPLFGYGPDNYLAAFRLHRPDRYVEVFGQTSTNSNAHSWVLNYGANLGILGALLLAAALASGIVRGRPRSGLRREEPASLLATAIWLGAIGYVAQMMLNVAMIGSTVPFWVLLGAIAAPHARRLTVPRGVGIATVVVCSVLVVATAAGSASLLAADSAYLASRLAYNGDGPGDPVALAEKAARLNPLSVKYARAVGQSRSALALKAIAGGGASPDEVRALYSDAKAAFDHTLALSPDDYAALSWLAGLQAAAGAYLEDPALLADAKATAQRAAAVDKTHWTVALLLKGDTSDAAIRLAVSAPALP